MRDNMDAKRDLGPFAGGSVKSRSGKMVELSQESFSGLKEGSNLNKVVLGRVVGLVVNEENIPYTFAMIGKEEDECVAVTVYNCSNNFGVIIGDSVAVAEPYIVDVDIVLAGKLKGGGTLTTDHARIYVRGGSGGRGLSLVGGVGGDGGDVYLEASSKQSLKSLLRLNPSRRFIAGKGEDSRKLKILGEKGKNLSVKVPLGITVSTDNRQEIGELNVEGEKLVVARGAEGGSAKTDFYPERGEPHILRLDLKLLADIGLVGFPNAGKSTLLKALSRANPKIASYPFTTLRPQLGMMEYDDMRKISVADLPGLIEGAYKNVGMGHRFLKHVERTSLLLLVVDVMGFKLNLDSPFRNSFQTVMLLIKELELYKEELLDKPAVLCVNKLDLPAADEKANFLIEQLENPEKHLSLIEEEMRPKKLLNFIEIFQISAKKRISVQELKEKLRTVLDDLDELKRDQELNYNQLFIGDFKSKRIKQYV